MLSSHKIKYTKSQFRYIPLRESNSIVHAANYTCQIWNHRLIYRKTNKHQVSTIQSNTHRARSQVRYVLVPTSTYLPSSNSLPGIKIQSFSAIPHPFQKMQPCQLCELAVSKISISMSPKAISAKWSLLLRREVKWLGRVETFQSRLKWTEKQSKSRCILCNRLRLSNKASKLIQFKSRQKRE